MGCKSKNRKPAPPKKIPPTPWDVVNVFGYALGAGRDMLDYTTRNASKYNCGWCDERKRLTALRRACLQRQAIMENASLLREEAQKQGHVYIPENLKRRIRVNETQQSASFMTVEELFLASQKRVESALDGFEKELPSWFCRPDYLMRQFVIDWDYGVEDFVDWCNHALCGCGSQPYMRDWEDLSSRVLRDDRDLVEELCALNGGDLTEWEFPYPRSMSNRRAHIERLKEFCIKNGPVVVELDTENTEASLAIAFLKCIEEEIPNAISQVNVYLGGMENKTWRHLSEFISSEVCVKEITRIRSQKSIMDTAIIASVMDVKYSKKANGVLLISSDCDFLVFDSQIPDMPICYCCTRRQASAATLKYLRENDLPSVYLDYVVNNLMASRVEQECVRAHVAAAITCSMPNLRDIVLPAVREVCPHSKVLAYTSSLGTMLKEVNLSVNTDGTVVVSIDEESGE